MRDHMEHTEQVTAYRAARVWTLQGETPLPDHAVVVRRGSIERVAPFEEVGSHVCIVDLGEVDLAPGFVDVQVNGGGGVLFNDSPVKSTLETIAKAHRAFGTTALLPTFITDSRDKMLAARMAVDRALADGVPGILGVHFEGPFLDDRKTGAHEPAFVRDASKEDLDTMFSGGLGVTLVTAAACRLGGGVLEDLLQRGARVSLGHCASDQAEASDAFRRGATGVTHLFNAMSPLGSRAPGLVGAALAADSVFAGIILDGIHVDFVAARAAYRALGPDRMMLVTDAVQPVGSDITEFQLGGRAVRFEDGRCLNEDGVLAGSALDMASAVRNAVHGMGAPLVHALRMASHTPAAFIGLAGELGLLAPGRRANLVALDADLEVTCVVQAGQRLDATA